MRRWDTWLHKVGKGCLAGLVALALWGWGNLSTQAEQRPSKTWKTCEEMSEAEKAALQMDCRWSYETPRHPQRSYAPSDLFPFKPPYTAEEILYLADTNTPNYRWDTEGVLNGKTINTRGSLYENQESSLLHYTTDEKTYWDRTMRLKGGDILQYTFAKFNLPPSNYGFGWIQIDYKIVPGEGTKPKEDNLFFIFESRHLNYQPAKGRFGITRLQTHFWDIRIDHMSDQFYEFFPPTNTNRDWEKALDPQRLLKVDEFEHPLNNFDITIKDPHLFSLRPALWPDKFPAHRGKKVMANITPQIAERIAKQDKAGRLVFDGEKQ